MTAGMSFSVVPALGLMSSLTELNGSHYVAFILIIFLFLFLRQLPIKFLGLLLSDILNFDMVYNFMSDEEKHSHHFDYCHSFLKPFLKGKFLRSGE